MWIFLNCLSHHGLVLTFSEPAWDWGGQIVKELDLKLTLGMAERRLTESPPDEESWGGDQWIKSRPDPKVTLSQMSRLFIDILYIAAVVIVRTINSRAKKIL